ncbi:hypothetical protein BC937DRAFT_87984 [Endogone sp. FLAS-F59071]|nr:hypothetical protein BC937DRAFT_87984 [Endogone sp. FLAS-F59071]|eukprot:RUS19112.1 hypothetical protein BC937DRAFT_87984 [Endogone sp. FLAS-F59071]
MVMATRSPSHTSGRVMALGTTHQERYRFATWPIKCSSAPVANHLSPFLQEWAARLLLERSLSIKSPTIAYQLTGSKKVQQVLASPRVLERFLSSAQADDLRVVFAGLYPLDASSTGRAALEAALREPHKFVLKPQREGGGNNVYGEDIRKVLEGLGERERSKFILMDLIRSPPFRGYMVREGQLIDAQVVSELGIFGIFLGSGPTVLLNETGGHLLRTKSHESNEGGVAAGFAVIDSPLLV